MDPILELTLERPFDLIRLNSLPASKARGRHPHYAKIFYVDDDSKTVYERVDGDLVALVYDDLSPFIEFVEASGFQGSDIDYAGEHRFEARIRLKLRIGGKLQEFVLEGDEPSEAIAKLEQLKAKMPTAEVVRLETNFSYNELTAYLQIYADGVFYVERLTGECYEGVTYDEDDLRQLGVRYLADIDEDMLYAEEPNCYSEGVIIDERLRDVTLNISKVYVGRPPRGHTGYERYRLKFPSGRRIGVSFI